MTDPIPKITRKLKSRVTDRFGHYYKYHLSLLLHRPSITQKPNPKMLRDINERSDAMTLQLLLDNLKDLEPQQKGKQAARECTDQEVATNYLRGDILAVRDTPTPHESAMAWVEDDAVSVAMSDLMSRITINDDNGESSSRSIPTSRTSNLIKQCVSCLEKFHAPMFKSSCGHEFCRDCLSQMFLGAIKDEELYPPRCYGEVVPDGIALWTLSYGKMMDFFKQRAIEWTAKDRLYCANPTCPNSSLHLRFKTRLALVQAVTKGPI
ncbi:hypothetical protein N7504_002523 [Penicillium tannophilum]|nr:hypothetical protein N7504_002523 [Penicillium tannophilum]